MIHGVDFIPFTHLFENEARWIMGPHLIGDVIHFARGRAFRLTDPDKHCIAHVAIPLPMVMNDFTGHYESIAGLVPPELRRIWDQRLDHVIRHRLVSLERALAPFSQPRNYRFTRFEVDQALHREENEAIFTGAGSLSDLLALYLGFDPRAVPQPGTFVPVREGIA